MVNVEVDFLVIPIQLKDGTNSVEVTWPEDRWLLGWGPWIGVVKANEFEGHLALEHISPDSSRNVVLFMRGPHKEDVSAYDYAANCDFFPTGYARFIPKGDKVVLQLHTSEGSQAGPSGVFAIQGSARVYSVKS